MQGVVNAFLQNFGTVLYGFVALICPPAALALTYKAPCVSADTPDSEHADEEVNFLASDKSTAYDTITTYRTDRLEGNGVGSMMSLQLNKLFKTASIKKPRKGKIMNGDELDELVENGIGHPKKVTIMSSKRNSINDSCDMLVEKRISLSAMAKMRAFYAAPITKFWSWCIAFMIFLMFSSYVLLIETPLLDQETPKLKEKCRVFYTKYYNLLTATALLFFLVGFGFRMQPMLRHSYGRVILSCSNVLWYMKVLEYLSVHPLLGPYIQMAAKMVVSMCYIIVLLLVTLMAFGVSRQAITFPHEKWNWLLVRNIFYKPYFMLYGEVYAGEIDTCGDEGTNCVPGGWIPPVLMTIFLLVANILLINMLIAIFNNIFNDTNIRSHEVWLFQRYWQVMEYNDTPLLPPPFTVLAYVARLFCFCKKKPLKAAKERDDVVINCSMRLYLNAEELRELHDFEEDCMDELTRKRLRSEKGEADDSWLNAMELTELTSQRVNELLQENYSLKSRLCDMEARMDIIAKSQKELMDVIMRKRKEMIEKAEADKEKSKPESSRASTQSLPEVDDARFRRATVAATEVSSITDHILLSPYPDRNKAASPLLSHLRMDQTLRKYDETRYQLSSLMRRPRLNSSSLSISQDMRDMDRGHRTSEVVTSDEDVPSVVVHEPWEDSS
ncbi:transporter, cation channel family protein [Ancylostoma ceylanicum]|uniref:Transporter, cation channel family protein n=1 Tax=Ancylostoma ceylanicum TaxID=53326 RepID=A0A0D6LVG4_9BILA|nr:transporter, cation channel family protein [Ancylostoma ceylanicum]